jgi:hypothetical protein
MCENEVEILASALHHLRSWSSGELRFDEHLRPIRFVLAPDGRLVMPVMAAVLQADETVLHVPVADEAALELLLCLEAFEEDGPDGALADRWRIYHGDPPDVYWAMGTIDLARFHSMVLDGEAMQQDNPLTSVEAGLCGEVNREHHQRLIQIVLDELNVEAIDPRLVGVDSTGLDIRGTFDVLHLDFSTRVIEPDQARQAMLDRLGIS